ncbi:MAG: hypothetical protein HY567_02010 [Candidatus Kerfeldbacteria bacterium]|nr:hypothetical protein [Candidatus Kerfeldbacteria bacterium]
MIDFVELEQLDFRGGDALTKLDDVLSEVAAYAEARTAVQVAQILQRQRQADPELARTIDPYLIKFRALALPLLTDREILAMFDQLVTIVADERIGLYERLRARLLALPVTRRTTLAQQILGVLRQSRQPLGSDTVGSWIQLFEARGGQRSPQALFQLPEFKRLNDQDDHSLRHIVHVVSLLASPETIELAVPPPVPTAESAPTATAVPPAPPANLPVAPAPADVPVGAAPVLRPSRVEPPAARPPPLSRTDHGPTMASVMARLQQSQQATAAIPPTVAHLTPDDEQEIRQQADVLAGLPAGPNVHDVVADAINRLIRENNLIFTDDNLRRRFVTIMTARIKDIRTSNETIELLVRAEKIGGLGFESTLADKLVAAASLEAARFHNHDEVRRLVTQQAVKQSSPLPSPPRVPAAPPPSSAPLTAPVPLRATMPTPPPSRPSPALEPTAAVLTPPLPTAATRPAQPERATVADIRGRSRLVGPVEELRGLTVVDFRRLGADPVACVRRVYEKIQQLARESFTKRADGIKAWRESEPHRLYVAMGQQGLLSSKSVREVLYARQQAGQAALTEQEFTLIADLNRKLRF